MEFKANKPCDSPRQLQLVCGTVCQRQCSAVFWVTGHFSMPSENWTVRVFLQLTPRLSNDFTAAWLTFTFRSYLLWPQPWSLSTIMLLWHSFLIIIIIIEIIVVTRSVLNLHHWVGRMWGKIVANVFLELNATEPDPWPIKWCTVNRFWQKVLTTQTHYRQKYGKVISITEHTV